MPRIARVKKIDGIYHIMSRSISDFPLFRDKTDKDKYLCLISKYKLIYQFKVYAFCLMTTHAHIELDCYGADISKIMKSINQSYAAYFNKKYSRHGHVFQDRFKSKLVTGIDYLLTLSAYIHNNPKDMKKYEKNVSAYSYSSLGIYLGKQPNKRGIINTDYILNFFKASKNKIDSYYNFVNNANSTEKATYEFTNQVSLTKNERQLLIRNCEPNKIIDFLSKYTDKPINIHTKFNHKNSEMKAIYVLILRSICNYSFKKIGQIIGNITIPNLWRLSEKAYKLITEKEDYKNILEDFISGQGNIQRA